MGLVAPGMQFTDNPIIRFGTLIISALAASAFYNYLTEGNDMNLFEDGKSKVMIIFVIIFIITVIVGLTMLK